MRPRWLLVTLGLALLLATPSVLAQSGLSIDTQAQVSDTSLSEASPLKPGQGFQAATNVTTPAGEDIQWRVFVNASIDGDTNKSRNNSWTGQSSQALDLTFRAPEDEGPHSVAWTVTVQSRNASGSDAWTTEDTQERSVGFSVRKLASQPSADDVSATVTTANGSALNQLPTFTPSENVPLNSSVTVPDVERTDWQIQISAAVNGTTVVDRQLERTSGGTVDLPLQFSVPSDEGVHSLTWTVDVNYRNETSTAWTNLSLLEGSSQVTVQQLEAPTEPGLPWVWILGIGAVAVGGGAGAYYLLREPKQITYETSRSKAKRELDDRAAVETEEPEVHPQLKILEARAEDVRRMIELAEERHERGDITEHQYEQIREKKEDELEEIQQEMEQYRQEGAAE